MSQLGLSFLGLKFFKKGLVWGWDWRTSLTIRGGAMTADAGDAAGLKGFRAGSSHNEAMVVSRWEARQ
jgi:hypothetical protein